MERSQRDFLCRLRRFLAEEDAEDAVQDLTLKVCLNHVRRLHGQNQAGLISDLIYECCGSLYWAFFEWRTRSIQGVRSREEEIFRISFCEQAKDFLEFWDLALGAFDQAAFGDEGGLIKQLVAERLARTGVYDVSSSVGFMALDSAERHELLLEVMLTAQGLIEKSLEKNTDRKRKRDNERESISQFWTGLPLGLAGHDFFLLRLMQLVMCLRLKKNLQEEKQRHDALRKLTFLLGPDVPPQSRRVGSGLLLFLRPKEDLTVCWPVELSSTERESLSALRFPTLLLAPECRQHPPQALIPQWLQLKEVEGRIAATVDVAKKAEWNLFGVWFDLEKTQEKTPLLFTSVWFLLMTQVLLFSEDCWRRISERVGALVNLIVPPGLLLCLHVALVALLERPQRMLKAIKAFDDHCSDIHPSPKTWFLHLILRLHEIALLEEAAPLSKGSKPMYDSERIRSCLKERKVCLPKPVGRFLGHLEKEMRMRPEVRCTQVPVRYELSVDQWGHTCLPSTCGSRKVVKDLTLDFLWSRESVCLQSLGGYVAEDLSIEKLIMLFVTPDGDDAQKYMENVLMKLEPSCLWAERMKANTFLSQFLQFAQLPEDEGVISEEQVRMGFERFVEKALEPTDPMDYSLDGWRRRRGIFEALFGKGDNYFEAETQMKGWKIDELVDKTYTLRFVDQTSKAEAPVAEAPKAEAHTTEPSQAPKAEAPEEASETPETLSQALQQRLHALSCQGNHEDIEKCVQEACFFRPNARPQTLKAVDLEALQRCGVQRAVHFGESDKRGQGEPSATLRTLESYFKMSAKHEQLHQQLQRLRALVDPILMKHQSSWDELTQGLESWWKEKGELGLLEDGLSDALGELCCVWIEEKKMLTGNPEKEQDRAALFDQLRKFSLGSPLIDITEAKSFSQDLLSKIKHAEAKERLQLLMNQRSGRALLLVMMTRHSSDAKYKGNLLQHFAQMDWEAVLKDLHTNSGRPFSALEKVLRGKTAK